MYKKLWCGLFHNAGVWFIEKSTDGNLIVDYTCTKCGCDHIWELNKYVSRTPAPGLQLIRAVKTWVSNVICEVLLGGYHVS